MQTESPSVENRVAPARPRSLPPSHIPSSGLFSHRNLAVVGGLLFLLAEGGPDTKRVFGLLPQLESKEDKKNNVLLVSVLLLLTRPPFSSTALGVACPLPCSPGTHLVPLASSLAVFCLA